MNAASLAGLLAAAAAIAGSAAWLSRSGSPDSSRTVAAEPAAGSATIFPVIVHGETLPPRVRVGERDGRPVEVACATCHATRRPEPALQDGAALVTFHQGLEYRHGDLSCLACHDATDYDRLRLASGQPVAFADRQDLCAQCHGQKARDWRRGAHGGMNGYWDLGRGPRTRLSCTGCHDPHAPAVPQMERTFWPRDRFVAPPPGAPPSGVASDAGGER